METKKETTHIKIPSFWMKSSLNDTERTMKGEKKNPILAKLSHKLVQGIQGATNLHRDTEFMEAIIIDTQEMADLCTNTAVKKKLEKLAEEFKYSDPVSSEATAEIEETLSDAVELLNDIAEDGDEETIVAHINKILALLKKRNSICKNAKK